MRIASFVVLVIVLNGFAQWLYNLPRYVGPDVPKGKLNSLSFAPFREGQSPLEEKFPTPEQLDADLRLLADKTLTIRTYASAEGSMPAIPPLARKYGLKMTQGAWLGIVKKDHQKEIQELIRAANAYPDVIKRVIVGNEVLLRGDFGPKELIGYIRQVKQAVKQPVSYADVWSMYMKYPELIREVDFITIHILPYWEDEPISVDQAPAHIERIYKHVRHEADLIAPGKPILIGESGWPSAGRQRGWAIPGIVNEAKFIRGLIKVANENGFDYNIVEAINQSWKSEFEGIVGANWGLFSVDRKEVFPLTGKVYEHAEWHKELVASTLIFLIAVLGYNKRLQRLTALRLASFLLFIQLLGFLLVNQLDNLWYTSYSDWQRLQSLLIVGLNAVLGGLITHRAYCLLSGQTNRPKLGSWLYTSYLLFAAFAIYKTFGLALAGRYLSFPLVSAYLPAAGIFALILIRYVTERQYSAAALEINRLVGDGHRKFPYDKIVGYGLIFTGLALIIGEFIAFAASRDFILAYPDIRERSAWAFIFTITNYQMLAWLACVGILAVPLLMRENKLSDDKIKVIKPLV
ncbi:Exo-beta-1,3-glucanase (GH17 family) [Candidatus Methylobacter favarea]|uniref:Endo-1,3-beta-glucanase btgC n=1 Tax=Candidatus Methylobacter favarea TaxID=2707345 RepID=A0A8S0X6V0_9GAMM|nr:exo-beta-1,3-glucanase [Candidatus Methylobacter favarea]CAA9889535.1 Exo-beta-1,3-glucanase (GH17 family) [Candidatus Methylobacter favarea]